MSIYKLTPAFKDYLWGGTRLKEKYGKSTELCPCAESWELSFHKDGLTTVDGTPLGDILTGRELGENTADFESFPVLIKLIDAKERLSVQVHPSDGYALEKEGCFGKTEMWYIVEADESAGIYIGFSKEVTEQDVKDAIKNDTLCELLQFKPVKPGECYFIPAGTVHAIGAGCLICEIQQNSNLTYRLYDYGRRDKNGNTRELHIDKALEVASLKRYIPRTLPKNLLGISKYFTAKKLTVNGSVRIDMCKKSFKSVTVVRGTGYINGISASMGDTFFVTADENSFMLSGDIEAILCEVRKYFIKKEEDVCGYKISLVDDLGDCIISVIGEDEGYAREQLLKMVNLTKSDILHQNA